jgi:hypothetical protein
MDVGYSVSATESAPDKKMSAELWRFLTPQQKEMVGKF